MCKLIPERHLKSKMTTVIRVIKIKFKLNETKYKNERHLLLSSSPHLMVTVEAFKTKMSYNLLYFNILLYEKKMSTK